MLAFSLVIVATLGRLIPHPWNMTPVAASAIFAGVKLGKRYAVIVPLCAMLIGDAVIGFYNWHMLIVVYSSMALAGVFAYLTRSRSGLAMFVGRPVFASVFFFLTTNAAVCVFGTMYAHSMLGLLTSYTAGLPFFARDLVGNIAYTALFFGVYEYALAYTSTRMSQRHLQAQTLS